MEAIHTKLATGHRWMCPEAGPCKNTRFHVVRTTTSLATKKVKIQ
jgi:hypothetical protein